MLQQTQVDRVRGGYRRFLRAFPTLHALARARQRDVVIAWQGMGYNNRAVRLQALARKVEEEYAGRIPAREEQLLALPGVGLYTARAMMSFAFRRRVVVVDVNVRRVLSRLFRRMPDTAATIDERAAWRLAERVLPARGTADWHQALMDLGSTVCMARRPRCTQCPVGSVCASRRTMRPAAPVPRIGERTMDGVPDRIYRGRIVERLRSVPRGTGLTLVELGRAVHGQFRKRHHRWFQGIVDRLARDGMIAVSRGPAGLQRTVRLA
jgi:A/G-specific adenine glycosylase